MSIKSAPVSNSFIINILIFRFHFFPSFLSTVVNQVYQHKLDDNPLVNTELNLVSSFQVQRIKRETAAAAAAKSLQSCPTLCDPIDGSPPSSPVPGILQARTLEWVAISFFNAWKWKVKVKSLSSVWLFATLCTTAYQAPPYMGCSRQEYWSGVPSPSPSDPPAPQILLLSHTVQFSISAFQMNVFL